MNRMYRLQVIEEEPYKKGGKVRKSKKSKKTRKGKVSQTVIVNIGQPKPKKSGKRQATKKQMLGAPSATTGMGSVVFGAPQAPSYFRAVGPEQQTFATLPASLKSLQEEQAKLFKELEKQTSQLRADAKMARDIAAGDSKQEETRKYVSRLSSRGASPAVSYGNITPVMSFSTAAAPSPIQTLRPLERQRTDTPPIMSPIMSPSPLLLSSSSIPFTAVRREPSWFGATSSREAGYMGADESLPVQAPASGSNMVPQKTVYDVSPESAFVPINASAPESNESAVERSAQVASRSVSAPRLTFYKEPGSNRFIKGSIPRPVLAQPQPEPQPEPQPKTDRQRVGELEAISKERALTAPEKAEQQALYTIQFNKMKAKIDAKAKAAKEAKAAKASSSDVFKD